MGRVFLDLWSVYNLVWGRAGDEWKMAFSMISSHYHYNVMSYGPAFFQSFMNAVFRDMLQKFVIVYLDNIPIYS